MSRPELISKPLRKLLTDDWWKQASAWHMVDIDGLPALVLTGGSKPLTFDEDTFGVLLLQAGHFPQIIGGPND